MKVEELSSYDKAFDHMPLRGLVLQMKVMYSKLKNKFGFWGIFGFIWKIYKKQGQLKKEYQEKIKREFPDVPKSIMVELYMMSSIYIVLSEIEGKQRAYDFILEIFTEIGPTAHEVLYDLKNLRKCKGDIYTNFSKLNRSIFENSGAKGFYTIEEINDSPNLQHIKLTKCLNIDMFSVLGVPELGKLGCTGDIAGYAPEAMGNKVNLDFRRPHTLINGDPACEFYYYRKGHAPVDMETI